MPLISFHPFNGFFIFILFYFYFIFYFIYFFQDNYPEILKNAFIVPANTVTRMLFIAASAMMDERSREKFKLIKTGDMNWWSSLFHGQSITTALGGYSQGYRRDFVIIDNNLQGYQ